MENSEDKISFLDTIVYKGKGFKSTSILDVETHFKPTQTFLYTSTSHLATHFGSRKASSKATAFSEQILEFKGTLDGEGIYRI